MDASPPKLRSLRATPVNVPLVRPHPTASGVVGSAPLVLVDLETDKGLVGHAYVFRRSCPNCRRVPYAHSAGRKPVGTARPDHEPFSGCLRRRHAGRHEDRRDYGLVAGGQPSGGSRFTGVESPVPGTQRAAAGGFAASPLAQVPGLAAPILQQPLEVKDGFALPQKAAGCGIAWDKAAVGVTGFARRAHPP